MTFVRTLCLIASTVGTAVFPFGQTSPSTDPVLQRAADYVRRYQAALTSVIATEEYSQQVAARYPPDPRVPRTRLLKSEVFFLYIKGYDWMTIRDVRTVDGKDLPARRSVRDYLTEYAPRELALQFKQENSRFNLGRTFRNFNEPTLSLLVLDDRYRSRFTFERKDIAQKSGAALTTLAFEETAEPTLIRDSSGAYVFASGELVVESATGRVVSASLTVEPDGVRMTLLTEYVYDERLEMLVPSRFREHYVNGTPPHDSRPIPGARQAQRQFRSFYEDLVCEATYSNFQRFEVTTRIK